MVKKYITSGPESSPKDSEGMYIKGGAPEDSSKSSDAPNPDITIDDILRRQLTALDRATRYLTRLSSSGVMTKDEIQSLATCIKVTLDLKEREKELLATLSDEQLSKIADDNQKTGQTSS